MNRKKENRIENLDYGFETTSTSITLEKKQKMNQINDKNDYIIKMISNDENIAEYEIIPRIKETRTSKSSILHDFRTKFSNIHPFIELSIVITLFFILSWLFYYAPDGNQLVSLFAAIGLGINFTWMTFGSHFIRGTTLSEIGCSDLQANKKKWSSIKFGENNGAFSLIAGMLIVMYLLFIKNLHEATHLIPGIGEFNSQITNALGSCEGIIIASVEFFLLFIFPMAFLLRTDNFKKSFMMHVKYLTPFITLLIFWTAFFYHDRVEAITFADGLSVLVGYIYWGFLQQIPFLGYVETTLRKGMEQQSLVTRYQTQKILSASITAVIFGLMHIGSIPLAIFAGIFEFFLALLYHEKKYRNLLVAAIFHALMGLFAVYFFKLI